MEGRPSVAKPFFSTRPLETLACYANLRKSDWEPIPLKSLLSSLLNPEPLGAVPSILVLQMRRIGELVLTTPALHLLRQTWPEAKITLVLAESCLELVPTLPKVNEVLPFRKKLRSNGPLLRRLLTGTFDVCLDFTGTDRSALFAIASRARRRLAFDWADKGPLRKLIYQNFVRVAVHSLHTVDHLLALLRPIGVQARNVEILPVLEVPPLAARRVQILLKECGAPADFALIHPGTAAVEKYWLPERWAEVILHLQRKHGLPCILTGGGEAEEQEHLRAIQTALAMLGDGPLPQPLVVLAGRLDLTLLTALTARCRLAVCCDTAVMHMASAFRRPQVSLFGPTNPFEWRPRHAQSLVVSAAVPLALSWTFNPEGATGPMSEIPSTTVCEAVDKLLSEEIISP